MGRTRIRRALFTASDKTGIAELARAMAEAGAELVATGRTAEVLKAAGLAVTPIEKLTGMPEAFQGRMKTLSFQVSSGILYRRGNPKDEADLTSLGILPIDAVVVNFYPFEKAAAKEGVTRSELVEEIDIGGPTLVRAAAKNAPDVLVLTDPAQYGAVIAELGRDGAVSSETALACAARAWMKVEAYDSAIAARMGDTPSRALRYGENPHQSARIRWEPDGAIAWDQKLTATEISYNNILDAASAYGLASDLELLARSIPGGASGVVIVKHNNPCGVALVPGTHAQAQQRALELAWAGDPVSAFGGVVVFTRELEESVAAWLSERFIELVAAPGLHERREPLERMLPKRKNLKALGIRRFGAVPSESVTLVPGGAVTQSTDLGLEEELRGVTRESWPEGRNRLALFGIAVTRSLKSNAVTLVREIVEGGGEAAPALQLVGAGQGQPNRIEAFEWLTVPRARRVLEAEGKTGASLADALGELILVSDAFFPFRDTVDAAARHGIRFIVQPGGSLKDGESIQACDEHGIAMAFTGTRHFRH